MLMRVRVRVRDKIKVKVRTLCAHACPHLPPPPDPEQMLIPSSGMAPLNALLSPLPSLHHSGIRFSTWLHVRAQLLCTSVEALHATLWANGSSQLPQPTLLTISRLGHASLQLHAWGLYPVLSGGGEGGGRGGVGVSSSSYPHPNVPLLALLLQILEVGRSAEEGGGLLQTGAAAVASGAAAVSSLVSWVSRKAVGGPGVDPTERTRGRVGVRGTRSMSCRSRQRERVKHGYMGK